MLPIIPVSSRSFTSRAEASAFQPGIRLAYPDAAQDVRMRSNGAATVHHDPRSRADRWCRTR